MKQSVHFGHEALGPPGFGEEAREAIIGRVLATGTWGDVTWLRQRIGDPALREWILRHEGRGLTPQQLRFWQLLLDLRP